MKRLIFIAVMAALLLAAPVFAADTVTVARTIVRAPGPSMRGVEKIVFTFSSDDGEIARAAANSAANVLGTIVKAHYVPDGTSTPDAGADIRLFTHLTTGVNILYAMIDDVGATETIVCPVTTTVYAPVFLGGETIYISATSLGAGTNAGVLTIWLVNP